MKIEINKIGLGIYDFQELAVTSDTLFLCGSSGIVQYENFKTLKRLTRKVFFNNVIADEKEMYATKKGEILFSSDFGSTWTKVKEQAGKCFRPFASGNGIIITNIEGGGTWLRAEKSNRNLWTTIKGPKNANDIWIGNNCIWTVGNKGMIAKSMDNGLTWNNITSPANYDWWNIWADNEGNIIISPENGFLYRSNNEGVHWRKLSPTGKVIFGNNENLFTIDFTGLLYSNNLGDTWAKVADVPDNPICMKGNSVEKFWILYGNTKYLYRCTSDAHGNASPENVKNNISEDLTQKDIVSGSPRSA